MPLPSEQSADGDQPRSPAHIKCKGEAIGRTVRLAGGHPPEYAIYWSPISLIEDLIALGSNVNCQDDAGFPALIAALSTDRHGRDDRLDVLKLLLRNGAEMTRGLKDWTPLHYAASTRDLEALRLLLEAGADPTVCTRIEDLTTRSRKPRRQVLPKAQRFCAEPWRCQPTVKTAIPTDRPGAGTTKSYMASDSDPALAGDWRSDLG